MTLLLFMQFWIKVIVLFQKYEKYALITINNANYLHIFLLTITFFAFFVVFVLVFYINAAQNDLIYKFNIQFTNRCWSLRISSHPFKKLRSLYIFITFLYELQLEHIPYLLSVQIIIVWNSVLHIHNCISLYICYTFLEIGNEI